MSKSKKIFYKLKAYLVLAVLFNIALAYIFLFHRKIFLRANLKVSCKTFLKCGSISLNRTDYLIGISDPLWFVWGNTSDTSLRSFFNAAALGLNKKSFSNLWLYSLVFFFGLMKRLGKLNEVEIFCIELAKTSNRCLRSVALWQVADVHHLYLRWQKQLDLPIQENCFSNFRKVFSFKASKEQRENVYFQTTLLFYQKAIEADPNFSWLYSEIGRLHREEENFQTAFDYFEKAKQDNASLIPLIYAARVKFFIDNDKTQYLKTLQDLNIGEKYKNSIPYQVDMIDFAALQTKLKNIEKIWDGQSQSISYRAAYNNEIQTVSKTINFKEIFTGHFDQVRCLSRPFALIHDRYLLKDTNHFPPKCYKMFCPNLLDYTEEIGSITLDKNIVLDDNVGFNISEPVIILGGSTYPDYYHFLFEAIGSLALIENNDHSQRKIVFSKPPARYQLELLKLLEFKNDVFVERKQHKYFNTVYSNALLLQCTSKSTIPHPKSIQFIRDKLYLDVGGSKSGKRIHLTRQSVRTISSKKKIEFLDCLKEHDFEIVEPGKMTIQQQREFFSDVELLTVEAGGACGNLIFCPPETKVIILAPASHVFEIWSTIASCIGQKLWMCLEDTETDYPAPYFLWNNLSLDVNINTFKICLNEALQSIESKTAHQ